MRQFKNYVKVGILAFASMVFGVTSCTKDNASPDSGVDTSKTEIPAEPGSENFQPENVYFAFDKSTIEDRAFANLDQLGSILQKNANATLEIQGHADERGSDEYNMVLGDRRAVAVKNYLVKLGVEEGRIKTISYGKMHPAMEGHNAEAWAKNRRAEFVISK